MNKRYDYVPYRTDRIVSVIARFVCRMMSGIQVNASFRIFRNARNAKLEVVFRCGQCGN